MSPDGSSWFAAYSSPVADEPVAAHMDTVVTQQGEGVTYLRRERDWLAVSGLKGGRIFYRKAVIACGGNMWPTLSNSRPRGSDKWICLSRLRAAGYSNNAIVKFPPQAKNFLLSVLRPVSPDTASQSGSRRGWVSPSPLPSNYRV